MVGGLLAVLNRAITIGLLKKVTFEQINKKIERDKGLREKEIASVKALST